jgi:acyl-CoA synthetase (AMP-forming)/AMP-acid ligase II
MTLPDLKEPPLGLAAHINSLLRVDAMAPAIEFEGEWIPWGSLLALREDLDLALIEAGAGPGASVGVILRNRPQHVAAVLALLATDRCVVTMNAVQGDDRLAGELAELRLPAVIADVEDWARPGVAQAAAIAGSTALHMAGPTPNLTDVRPGTGGSAPDRPGVAFELLTSGTTGPPKRVDLLYRSLEMALISAKEYETSSRSPASGVLRESVAVIHSRLVHVSGIWHLLQAVGAGRRMALAERFTVETWRGMVVRHRPTSSSLVPSAMRMVLDADVPADDLRSLRAVVAGTAPLDPALAEEFEDRYGIPVLVVYGATEFAGGVAGWTLKDRLAHREDKRGSVGRANAGVTLRVVDESGRELPLGKQGVLEVRSAQLETDRWVRTTDLASLDEDGFLFIHGRTDDVIIRGGFKVHPAAVEAALEQHPAVAVACVVGLPDRRLGAVPVAAVELVVGAETNPEELREHAAGLLVGYQVPDRVIIVPVLPRTPSMKPSRHETRRLLAGPNKEMP